MEKTVNQTGKKTRYWMLWALPLMMAAAGPATAAKSSSSGTTALTERCAQEAQDANVPAGGEFNSYVSDCVRDLQDLRKQGLDLAGTHEDPASQQLQQSSGKPKKKVKGKARTKGKAKKKKKSR